MARYRKQQDVGDNLRDLYSKFQQWISSHLGSSSIDWEDEGDDDESLDITVGAGDDYTTVAKYGHGGGKHGHLVPDGSGGWLTVQEDAQAKADAAEAAAKGYADDKDAATRSWAQAKADAAEAAAKGYADDKDAATRSWADGRLDSLDHRLDTVEASQSDMWSDITSLQSSLSGVRNEVHDARGSFSDLDARLDSLAARISALEKL